MLYSKQIAWLASYPKDSKNTRLEHHKLKGAEIELPDIDGAEYLIGLLHEAGTLSQGGMGVSPLSWQEIESWQRCSKRVLTSWEISTIREMSLAYAAQYSNANDAECSSPFSNEIEIDRTKAAINIANVLRNFSSKSGNIETPVVADS